MTPDRLQDRLLTFAEATCRFLAPLGKGAVAKQVSPQLLRSATAPAAIYAEARGAETRRDFVHKMQLCLKDLRETKVWLELLRRLDDPSPARHLATECHELTAIFVTSIKTARRGLDLRRPPKK